jgi:NAD(P)-dependent dehydrogenase (short-subunit alcohol dehydrogenase family)
VVADVTQEAEVADAVSATATALGGLDGLVCCAGVSGPVGAAAADIPGGAMAHVLAVNVTGAFLTVKHSAPHLATGRDPAIVLLASDSAFTSAPGMAPYCSSKGAVLALGRSLAVDLRPSGIRVNCLCPSIVDTPMSRGDLDRPGGFADADFPVQTPEEVAVLAVLLLSRAARTVNGTHLLADFGLSAASPFPA